MPSAIDLLALVPRPLAELCQWMPTVGIPAADATTDALRALKRPRYPVNSPQWLFTLTDLALNSAPMVSNFGLVTTLESPLCIIDVDHIAEASPTARAAIDALSERTYTEWSLSGKGLHILFYILSPKVHHRAYIKAGVQYPWSGQLSLYHNFMVSTGLRCPQSPTHLETFAIQDLEVLFGASRTFHAWKTDTNPDTDMSAAETAFRLSASKRFDEHSDSESDMDTDPDSDSIQRSELASSLKEYIEHGTGVFGITAETKSSVPSGSATWKTVDAHLHMLTLDQNPRVVRAWEAVTQTTYEHYDFWLKIGMALHFEATRLNQVADGLRSFIRWSSDDPTSFESTESVVAKWSSFGESAKLTTQEPVVTYRTIEAMVRRLEIPWVDISPKTGLPDQSSLSNMRILLNYYSVSAKLWPGVGCFLTADPDVMESVFDPSSPTSERCSGMPVQDGRVFGMAGPYTEGLRLNLALLAQVKAKWRGQHKAYSADLTEVVLTDSVTLNPVHTWLTTESADLPAVLREQDHIASMRVKALSTFDHFMSAFHFPDSVDGSSELSTKMLKAMLMQIVRLSDPLASKEHNEGMVVLIGPEGSHKTSFFRWLFPQALSKLIVEWRENVGSDKNKRDMARALAGAGLFLMDECDYALRGDEVASWLKSILTSTTVDFTEIYAKSRTSIPRTAIVAGTTNSRDIWLSTSGNRRMWLIDVEDIDIDFLEKNVSRYWLYRSLVAEYNEARLAGERPWLMSPDDFGAIRESNARMSTKSSLGYDLEEEFQPLSSRGKPMSVEDMRKVIGNPRAPDNPHVFTTKRIKALLKMRGVSDRSLQNTTALRHELIRLSKSYTGRTNSVKIESIGHSVYIYSEGEITYDKNRKVWLLPALRSEDEQ